MCGWFEEWEGNCIVIEIIYDLHTLVSVWWEINSQMNIWFNELVHPLWNLQSSKKCEKWNWKTCKTHFFNFSKDTHAKKI